MSQQQQQPFLLCRNKHWPYIASYAGGLWREAPLNYLKLIATTLVTGGIQDSLLPNIAKLNKVKQREWRGMNKSSTRILENNHLRGKETTGMEIAHATTIQQNANQNHNANKNTNNNHTLEDAIDLYPPQITSPLLLETLQIRLHVDSAISTLHHANNVQSIQLKQKLLVQATTHIAHAYALDEIKAAVITMHASPTLLDDLPQRILKFSPNCFWAMYASAFHEKIGMGDLEKSSTVMLDKCIAMRPQEWFLYRTRAMFHLFRNDYPASLQDFETSLKLLTDPNLIAVLQSTPLDSRTQTKQLINSQKANLWFLMGATYHHFAMSLLKTSVPSPAGGFSKPTKLLRKSTTCYQKFVNLTSMEPYHPLTLEAQYATLLNHLIVSTETHSHTDERAVSPEKLLHQIMIARSAEFATGMPLFYPPQSLARMDWASILNALRDPIQSWQRPGPIVKTVLHDNTHATQVSITSMAHYLTTQRRRIKPTARSCAIATWICANGTPQIWDCLVEALATETEMDRRMDILADNEDACGNCGGDGKLLCGRCRKVKYCSKECQRKAWHAGHRDICDSELKVYENMNESGINSLIEDGIEFPEID